MLEPTRELWGASGARQGASGTPQGGSWELLGRPRECLGVLFGHLGEAFGAQRARWERKRRESEIHCFT